MTLSTRVVFFSFWFTCEKGSVKVNRTKQQQKKIYIWSGPSDLVDFPGVNTPLYSGGQID